MTQKIITKIFKTRLQEDSKAAGRWETSQGGEYFAAGVGGAITGRGADLLIIDDPHSEQDALSPTAMESAYEWYTSGPRQRLQPGGKIVLVMTRWTTKDLTGMLVKNQKNLKLINGTWSSFQQSWTTDQRTLNLFGLSIGS